MIRWVQNIRYSLVSKLILSVGATLLISISIWAGFNIRIQKEKLMQHILKDTVRLCNTIQLGTHYAMLHNSRDDINQIINNIARQKEIRNIRVYNKHGQIKFSNRMAEVDQFTNIKAEACDVCHQTDPPLSRLEMSRRTRLFDGPEGKPLLGIITSIQNEPGCASGACHVHRPDQTVLGAIDVVFSLDETYRDIERFETGVVFLAIIVFLLTSATIAGLMLRFLSDPITDLINGTQAIARGNYRTRIKVASEDEIGKLAQAVNTMAGEIGRHQEELRRKKDEYQNLFEHVPCEISVQDTGFRLLRFNRNFARKFNPTVGDFCYHAYKGRNRKCEDCPLEKTLRDGEPHYGEETGVNKSGETVHWILVTAPIRNAQGEIEAAIEMSLDITNTRLLENQLQASERKYRTIFDTIPTAVFVLDADTLEILDCNESVVAVYGFSRESLLHKNFLTLFAADERERYAGDLRGRSDLTQVRQRHESGRTLFVNIRAAWSEHDGHAELLVTASDITQRLETEQQLIQASKMATLGEMAAGIAHELNQPLSVIKTASGFFIRKIKKGESIDPDIQRELSTEIDEHVNRASNIINHMREFGRKSDLKPVPVRIDQVMGRAFDLFSQQLKLRGITVSWEIEEELPEILGDPSRLEQVFINLLINARDAIEERWQGASGTETGGGPGGPEKRIDLRGRLRDDRVVVEVEDTGPGIPEGLREKIFEPFFTTKEVGKGTGLGLSISYGIVRECNGTIQARAGGLGGACFVISFPVHEMEADVDIEYGDARMTVTT